MDWYLLYQININHLSLVHSAKAGCTFLKNNFERLQMSLFIQQLLNGISNSSVLFLTSIGLVIIFGMMDVVNNAHGEFIMIGAYITCFSVNVLHLPFA